MKQALIALLFATPAVAQYTAQTIPSMPLNTFQNSLGINLHMEYSDGLYVNEQQVLSDLNYLGITHARDNVPQPGWAWQGLPDLEALMGAGIKFDLVSNCGDNLSADIQQMTALAQQYPGSIATIEGTNEVNNQPCGGNGGNYNASVASATAYQQSLYNSVKGSSVLSPSPVLYYTGNPTISSIGGLADATNTHPYPANGVEPYARLLSDFQTYFTGSAANAPRYITETGYPTQYAGNGASNVDTTAQAEMLLTTYFDAALQGVKATYVYQLLEAYPSNSGPGSDAAFGLFNYSDGSPLPAAQALHRLAQYLPADQPSSQKTVQAIIEADNNNNPVPMPGISHSLALTAKNGDVYVCTWDELPVWNSSGNSRIDYVPGQIFIQVPGTWSSVTYFAPEWVGVPGQNNTGYTTKLYPYGTYNGAAFYRAPMPTDPSCVAFHK